MSLPVSPLEKIKKEFQEVVKLVNTTLGEGYALKNPGLIQHLLDKVQEEEERALRKKINNL